MKSHLSQKTLGRQDFTMDISGKSTKEPQRQNIWAKDFYLLSSNLHMLD